MLPVEARASGGLGNLATAAAAFGVNLPTGEGGDSNYVEILQSRNLREGLLGAEFIFSERGGLLSHPVNHKQTLYSYLKAKNLDRGLESLTSVVSANRDLKTKILTITAETRSPELSRQLAEKSVKLLEAYLVNRGQTRGSYKAAFASLRLEDARKECSTAEDALRRFLEGNRNYAVSQDPSVRLLGSRLEMELRLRQQLITTLAMNREQALMEEKNDVPILNILDSANLPIEKSRPRRSLMVLAFAFVAFLGVVGWDQRKWLQAKFLEEPLSGGTPSTDGMLPR